MPASRQSEIITIFALLNIKTVIMRVTFPPLDAKQMKEWRLNYTATYADERCRNAFSSIVSTTLRNVAFLQGIECEISERHQFSCDEDYKEIAAFQQMPTDLVYFRSSRYSRMTRSEFRKLISMIFDGYPNVFSRGCPFEVLPQKLSALKEYPFPSSWRDFSVEF